MKFDDLTVEDITKLAAVASGAITLVTKLGFLVTDIIAKSKDMTEEDKDALIKRITDAQSTIPEWE
jgi:hypothetical protein